MPNDSVLRQAKLIDLWLLGKLPGQCGKTQKVKPLVRKYLLDTFGERCSICSWAERNPVTNKVPIEVDHIDGDASNTVPTNVRLICPNCHSLTPTFRNLNKGKSSRNRKPI